MMRPRTTLPNPSDSPCPDPVDDQERRRPPNDKAPSVWGDVSYNALHALATEFATPFFLYDADTVRSRIVRSRAALGDLAKIYYAVKANPNLELLRAVRGVADGVDISSGGELDQAQLAGFAMANVSFAGPAKTTPELSESIARGVGCISIESEAELAECVRLSRASGVPANVTVRINPVVLNRSFGIKMGGKPIQFGIDEENVGAVLNMVRSLDDVVRFQGIHIYAGSQCFDARGIVEGVERTLRIARDVEVSTGLQCRMINFGGGFGVAHGDDGRELDMDELSVALVPILRTFHETSAFERKLVFELGRYLTARAGIYICRVVSMKESRGKNFYMVDGGLHHHLAAAGTFGATLRSNYALRNLSRPFAQTVRCNVAGPSCNPTDLLAIDVELAKPERGDLIGVMNAGSYGLTASPLLFLGRQTPAEIVRRDGEFVLARRSRTVLDFN